MAIQLVVPGDVILPQPIWNSYKPQVILAGKNVIPVPIPAECGGVPEPAALRRAILASRSTGLDPRILVLAVPDNPTGTFASPDLVRQVCGIAREEDLLVVSDEIYRDLVHDPAAAFLSPAEVAPERTIVTSGLSKSLALGGFRIGVARLPAGQYGEWLRDGLISVASELWSTLAGPMQAVAEYAFTEGDDIRSWVRRCARLHGQVARAVHQAVSSAGATCRPPTAGFYVYPDLEPIRPQLARLGVDGCGALQHHLLDKFGIAVLAGQELGDDPAALRFRAATSMLYGPTADLQEAALSAEDPLRLPHIHQVITRVADVFDRLAAGKGADH
jgi:aspartate aminotransferase